MKAVQQAVSSISESLFVDKQRSFLQIMTNCVVRWICVVWQKETLDGIQLMIV